MAQKPVLRAEVGARALRVRSVSREARSVRGASRELHRSVAEVALLLLLLPNFHLTWHWEPPGVNPPPSCKFLGEFFSNNAE